MHGISALAVLAAIMGTAEAAHAYVTSDSFGTHTTAPGVAAYGVNVDGVVRLLEQRGYIEEQGRAAGPGQPLLYGTTELFLDRMGLATLRDLPPIEEFMPPVETANALAEEMAS